MQQQPAHARGLRPFGISPIEATHQSFAWFADMRAEHPIFHDEQMGLWQVFRYNDVQRVLTDYEHFSSESVPGFSEDSFLKNTVVAKDPPDHRKLRNLVNLAFTPRAVNHLSEDITRITHELLRDRLSEGHMDVVSDIAFPLPAKVIATMMGIPAEDWDLFRHWVSGSDDSTATQTREEAERSHHMMNQQMHDYFIALLAERRRSPREDLISSLSVAEIDGTRLSENELVSFCILLLVAGQETTKNLIANAIYCLTQHPQAYAQLVHTPDLVPTAIEEVLRYLPPVWFGFRRTTTEIELSGQRIPANAIIQAWNASANHDATAFTNPEQFLIQREPNRHLTFGHGIHFCIGAPLARLETRIVLPIILDQLKHLQLAPNPSITVYAGLVYIIRSLPITFQAG